MNQNELNVVLKTVLDHAGINTDLRNIQKVIDKYPQSITTKLETAATKRQMQSLSNEIARDLNRKLGTSLSGSDIYQTYTAHAKELVRQNQAVKNSLSGLDKLKTIWSSFGGPAFATSALSKGLTELKQSISDLKEMDTLLTQINKSTLHLSGKDLALLGDQALLEAGKYGKTAIDYLTALREMTSAGYENNQEMSELSLLTQSAGDLTAELANNYLIAADAAFGYHGNVKKLTELLDGQNQITSRNAVSMKELATATQSAGSLLAGTANLEENELTALLGTGIATSRESGENVAKAIKSIVMNLQQVKGDLNFEGGVIDEKQLETVEARCRSVGVELRYMQDGIAALRDPIDILDDLAKAYNSLPVDSPDRTGIISDIGGKFYAGILSSLLSNWDVYEKMLGDFDQSTGAAMQNAMLSASSWEGSLNSLSNTWTDTVQNIANSDGIIAGINALNGLLGVLNHLTDFLGPAGSIGLGISAVLGAKNLGKQVRVYPFQTIVLNMPSMPKKHFSRAGMCRSSQPAWFYKINRNWELLSPSAGKWYITAGCGYNAV